MSHVTRTESSYSASCSIRGQAGLELARHVPRRLGDDTQPKAGDVATGHHRRLPGIVYTVYNRGGMIGLTVVVCDCDGMTVLV